MTHSETISQFDMEKNISPVEDDNLNIRVVDATEGEATKGMYMDST